MSASPSPMASLACVSVQGFAQRFSDLRLHRSTSDLLFEDLLKYCHDVTNDLQAKNEKLEDDVRNYTYDLKDSTTTRRQLQAKIETLEATNKDLAYLYDDLKHRNPYTVLLIDGDGLLFQNHWIQRGLEGGKQAAYALRTAIAAKCPDRAGDVEIVVKVVANLSGLSNAMKRCGVVNNESVVREFWQGFTQAKSTFDFVDVGSGKERADSKIRGLTKWHLGNQNCKQVLLGISHDSGYAPFLDEILQDQATRDRVAVLEGTAIEYQLVETHVHVMKGTELDKGLFRGDKLSTERPIDRISSFTSSYNRAPPSPESTSSNVATPAPSTLVPWSAAVKTISPPPQMTTPLGGKYGVKPAQAPPPELNGWNPGERGLDKPINFSRTVYQSMKGRGPKERLCNNHYLRGPCMKLDQCQFIHDEAPTKDELAVIAYMSRMNPCTAGQYCDEDSCIYGHHCPSAKDGVCSHPTCRFTAELHPPGCRILSQSNLKF